MIRLTIYVLFFVLIFINVGYSDNKEQYGVLIKKAKLLKNPKYYSSWYRANISVGDTLYILSDDHEKYFLVEYGSYSGWINKKRINPIILKKNISIDEFPDSNKQKNNQNNFEQDKSSDKSSDSKNEKNNQKISISLHEKTYLTDQISDTIKLIKPKYVLYLLILIATYRIRTFLLKPINTYKSIKNWVENTYYKIKGIISGKKVYEKQLRDFIEEDIYWENGIWTNYDIYPWVQAF